MYLFITILDKFGLENSSKCKLAVKSVDQNEREAQIFFELNFFKTVVSKKVKKCKFKLRF